MTLHQTVDSGSQLPKTRCILVVDDNPAVLKLMGSLFAEQGINVCLASSVSEAKAYLQRREPPFDLVLSDIQMPGETGFDLLQWIKQKDSLFFELPVLLTTAQLPEAANRLKGLAMGAVDYVVRPIELSELVLRSINAIDHFQHVKALEASLQDSENLAMIGRLMAASNHEVKNLATIVHVCASQVQRLTAGTSSLDAKATAALRSLGEAAKLLTEVSRHLSGIATTPVVKQPVELATLAQQVLELMQPMIRPYRLELAAHPPLWVLAHEVRLKQVLINLILNARDAIAELQPEEGGCMKVRLEADESVARLSLTDNGIGFDAPGERREFAAFSTTKKLRGGHGLGLWLCARMAADMNGTLTLASAGVAKGVTATLTLPQCEAPRPDALALEVERYLQDLE